MYRYLVVWYKPNNKSYYYKILKHNYNNYYVGYINEYNHVVIVCEDISKFLFVTKNYYSIKRRIVKKLVNFLNKI